ncbi:MAG TPA: histidinol dehydrogenase, partial [Solirubrobacteraceae bacterium]|nr:histidinol dehydrogenase [Solirubrobacteraceae bacterium]
QCERFTAPVNDPIETAQRLRDLIPAPDSVQDDVAGIIASVRTGGDAALLDYVRRFDTAGNDPLAITVDHYELESAANRLDPLVRHGIERAIENLEAVLVASHDPSELSVDLGSHRIVQRRIPVARAAVYVPGGRAPYPSTVVMGVVPARLAGVEHIALAAPPQARGDIDPVILAAAALTGASSVYRMGGAHAIAALAYGTETIQPVDVIVGPGNLYVQEAKRQVFGQVGIDGFAGPSDLVAIATQDADTDMLALDLLAQAEHGPGTLVIAISDDDRTLTVLESRLATGADTGAVVALVLANDPEHALALSEAFAPEHLQLIGQAAEALSDRVTKAGCLFVGVNAGTAFGDYIAGSNHILPTNGAARFASGLSPEHFVRRFSEVRIGDPDEPAASAAPLAQAEGFELHARSMQARIRDNDSR